MPDATRKCRLIFDGSSANQPTLWKMTRHFPNVQFDIRLDDTGVGGHTMSVVFSGQPDDLDQALQYLRDAGVQVTPTPAD